MVDRSEFAPDWCSPPGDTILDIIQRRSISPATLASMLGQPASVVDELLTGRIPIDATLARKLSDTIGASATFWENRESHYRSELRRLQFEEHEANWLAQLPTGDMARFGWIPKLTRTKDKVAACLKFFGVESPIEWQNRYNAPFSSAAFRTSPSFRSELGAVAAWLRRGEQIADGIECAPWNAQGLKHALPQLRALTRKHNPETFIPTLTSICAAQGVAVVVARAPNGCRASGATRFLSPEKVLLLLSFRHLTDDHFWFSFFHEVGHLLLHADDGVFVDLDGDPLSPAEQEANDFAARTLIPAEFHDELMRVTPLARDIARLAMRIGVSPGIVVGQLQHRGLLGFERMNRLKRRFAWK